MPGAAPFVRGATGPAPTTVWFGAVPDRLNMLLPTHDDAAWGPTKVYDSLVSADYLNLWTPWNLSYGSGSNSLVASFGSFTTAPDGTTDTAQQMVESATNTRHFVCAGSLNATDGPGQMRLAGFFKYAGRRVALTIAACANVAYSDNTPFGGRCNGVRAIFDLQNGQVGVDSTKFTVTAGYGDLWETHPAQIISFGGGWYLCYLDAFVYNNLAGFTPSFPQHIYCYVELDNGTATDAESLTYSGDGTSGVYGWRTNMLPPAAWGMNNTCFFEDFNDDARGNFDLADTLDPTKTWFIRNGTPFIPNSFDPVTPIADLIVSGSVLNIAPTIAFDVTLTTYAALNQNSLTAGWVGQGWKLPALYECSLRWDFDNDNGTGNIAFWTWSLEYVTGQPDPALSQGPAVISLIGREMDFWESRTGINPNSSLINYYPTRLTETTGIARSSYGAAPWGAIHTYRFGAIVVHGGIYYQTVLDFNTNHEPPNATWWSVYTPAMVTVDWNEFQTVQTLALPYVPGDTGKMIQFLNGIYVSVVGSWSPTIDFGFGVMPNTITHPSDGQTFPIILGGSSYFNTYFDWVRVTQ